MSLYLPTGMIGSGKSTWAREFIGTKVGIKVVAGDDIRYMLAGGKKYVYDPALEPTVMDILFSSTRILLDHGYDVILDECYCSLNAEMRERVANAFKSPHIRITAVVFPERDMKDHIDDKVDKGLRGKSIAYWKNVFCEMKEIYEPFNPEKEYYFTRQLIQEGSK